MSQIVSVVDTRESAAVRMTKVSARGDQIVGLSLCDETGKILANLYPDALVSNKKAFCVRVVYYNAKDQRVTRFLSAPKNDAPGEPPSKVSTVLDFKIGDQVRYLRDSVGDTSKSYLIGTVGTVCHIHSPAIGVRYEEPIGVHNCEGRCEDTHGVYLYEKDIELIVENSNISGVVEKEIE